MPFSFSLRLNFLRLVLNKMNLLFYLIERYCAAAAATTACFCFANNDRSAAVAAVLSIFTRANNTLHIVLHARTLKQECVCV